MEQERHPLNPPPSQKRFQKNLKKLDENDKLSKNVKLGVLYKQERKEIK